VNVQSVRRQCWCKCTDTCESWWSTSWPRLVAVHPISSVMQFSVPRCSLIVDSDICTSPASTPNMVVKQILIRAVWEPGIFVNEVWTTSCKPLLGWFCCMRRSSILLEYELLAKQMNDVTIMSLLSWYSVVFIILFLTDNNNLLMSQMHVHVVHLKIMH